MDWHRKEDGLLDEISVPNALICNLCNNILGHGLGSDSVFTRS